MPLEANTHATTSQPPEPKNMPQQQHSQRVTPRHSWTYSRWKRKRVIERHDHPNPDTAYLRRRAQEVSASRPDAPPAWGPWRKTSRRSFPSTGVTKPRGSHREPVSQQTAAPQDRTRRAPNRREHMRGLGSGRHTGDKRLTTLGTRGLARACAFAHVRAVLDVAHRAFTLQHTDTTLETLCAES